MSIKPDLINAHTPPTGLEYLHDEMERGQRFNQVPSNAGLVDSETPVKHLTYKKARNEKVIRKKGSYIVLGSDRTGTLVQGTGPKGYTKSAAIDLVVGRGANLKKGQGPPNGQVVGPLFVSDAARIYISESTNIDAAFGLATVPGDAHRDSKDHPLSAVGIKADNVRMVARNNIKIVTGRNQGYTGGKELNSLGGRSPQAGTISLIGGNYTESHVKLLGAFDPDGPIKSVPYLQAAIKGDNLVHCLNSLYQYVDQLESVVWNLLLTTLSKGVSKALDPFASPLSRTADLRALGEEVPWSLVNSYDSFTWSITQRERFLSYGGDMHIRSANVYLT
jgi:hypothetical protein